MNMINESQLNARVPTSQRLKSEISGAKLKWECKKSLNRVWWNVSPWKPQFWTQNPVDGPI